MSNSCCRSCSRLTTCAWIDTSSAETGSSATSSFGLSVERAGDADALALAAGELVGVAVVVLGVEPDDLEQLLHPRAAPCFFGTMLCTCERRADDRADGVPRVQRGVGVLEDHLDVAPQRLHLPAATAARGRGPRTSSTRRWAVEPGDQPAGGGLAAAGLAHQAERRRPWAPGTRCRRRPARGRSCAGSAPTDFTGKYILRSSTSRTARRRVERRGGAALESVRRCPRCGRLGALGRRRARGLSRRARPAGSAPVGHRVLVIGSPRPGRGRSPAAPRSGRSARGRPGGSA